MPEKRGEGLLTSTAVLSGRLSGHWKITAKLQRGLTGLLPNTLCLLAERGPRTRDRIASQKPWPPAPIQKWENSAWKKPGQSPKARQVLLLRMCVMEPTTGVTCRGIGLTRGVAKVWRWLNQPERRRMVLMPTVWPTPFSVPARIPQGSGSAGCYPSQVKQLASDGCSAWSGCSSSFPAYDLCKNQNF